VSRASVPGRGHARPGLGTAAFVLLASTVAAVALLAEPRPPKALVEFGWDEPDTAFLRAHLQEMAGTPFDGCVYHALSRGKDGRPGNFTWEAWGRRSFADAELAGARADLRALPATPFGARFLRVNVTPGDVDWFDDYTPILGNVRLAAQLAREGRGPGLLLDVENYAHPLFDYARQRDRATRSFEDYAAQARRRGREVMRAAQHGARGTVVFLTFGASLPLVQQRGGQVPLSQTSYGLLAPFVDGLASAAPRGGLVDGYELSYGERDPAAFARARWTMREGARTLLRQPGPYDRALSVGFGLWLDYDWRRLGWHPDAPETNYFTPALLERSVTAALAQSDRYVWVYSETPRWWGPQGRVALPPAYEDALRRARAAAGLR
jgi:hypothetical protein